ncbi:carbon-nitrogen hydrolase family protein [Spirochaetota bacterium]
MESFRAAVIQLTSKGVVQENLEVSYKLIRKASENGADFIALPENFSWMRLPNSDSPPVYSFKSSDTNPIIDDLSKLSRQLGCYILIGSLPEKAGDDGRHYNTSFLIDPHGTIIGKYRKRHLFDVDLNDGTALRESDDIISGDEIVSVKTPLGVFGLSICYDLRFPEHYRKLAHMNSEVMTVPSAFTEYTGRAHWHILLRARAIENQCYVIAPNQTGRHGDDRVSFGHSLIVDPWGEVIADAGEDEGFAVADLEPEKLTSVRESLPALRHRK